MTSATTSTTVRLAMLLVASGCASPEPPAAEHQSTPAPAVGTVLDLAGAPVDPLAAGEPTVRVLLFVSTHCPVSNRYAPILRELASTWPAARVATWWVYPDPDDDPAAIRAHMDAHDVAFPVARDPEHVLVARAGVRVTPEAAVFEAGAASPAYAGRIDDRVVELGKFRATAGTHELADAVAAVTSRREPAPAPAPAVGCYISDLR